MNAEGGCCGSAQGEMMVLQWGRVLMNAEMVLVQVAQLQRPNRQIASTLYISSRDHSIGERIGLYLAYYQRASGAGVKPQHLTARGVQNVKKHLATRVHTT
jgi:hypothetical protein